MMDTEQPIASPMDPHSPPRNKDLVLKRKMRGGSPTPSDPSQWNKAKNELPKVKIVKLSNTSLHN